MRRSADVPEQPSTVSTALLAQRLQAVAPALLPAGAAAVEARPAPRAVGELLDRLVRAVLTEPTTDRLWLLQVAVSGRWPDTDDAVAARRAADLLDAAGLALWLLDDARVAAVTEGSGNAPLELVTDALLVDVDYTAQHDLHSGIQRVVRSVLPWWSAWADAGDGPAVVPAVWVEGHRIMRRLTPGEEERVLRWGDTRRRFVETPADAAARPVLVPWRCTVVELEVPWQPACERLAALGRFSGSRLGVVGYDCIPVVSAPSVPLSEPNRFVHYLTLVKNAHRLAAISASAAEEFRGFTAMLPTQGLTGPDVVTCPLPVDRPDPPAAPAAPGGGDDDRGPLVVCVGSFEPRKNQLSLLTAAEVLWREGLRFRLRFIGASGWGRTLPRLIGRLRSEGRAVEQLTAVSEQDLEASYRQARFTAFVSTHEGYGLPVAESLARGVPVLASDYGSVAEIAEGGGALTVDPRDIDALTDALRRLLTDDDLVAHLRAQIADRPIGRWSDYARDLRDTLAPVERSTAADRVPADLAPATVAPGA